MINIKQILRTITHKEVDDASNIIILVKSTERFSADDLFPYAATIKARLKRLKKTSLAKNTLLCDLPNALGTRLAIAGATSKSSTFDCLTFARKIIQKHLQQQPKKLIIHLVDLEPATEAVYVEALVAALLAANYPLPNYKSKPTPHSPLEQLVIYGLSKKIDLSLTLASAAGNNLARQLTIQPSNYLTPSNYLKEVRLLAKTHQWKLNFFDIQALQKKKAGAFLAVAQGSETNDAGIAHLHYKPTKTTKTSTKKKLSLVGKGICYDTGGTNLKPSKSMFGMHEDMEGSAVALGTFLALSTLKVDFEVDCWLAITNNMIGPLAYKQNDIITAMNGTTIEIVHTDAEGRMVLADTLALACETHPALIIDYATLTGSCVTALGTRYSGATTNRCELLNDIITAGQSSGERVWPFPSDDDYDDDIESQIADVKQCNLGNEADHIIGARFLGLFVNNIPWIHVDLSSGNNKGGLAHIPTDITGVGVRFTLDLLLKQNILKKV